MNQTWENGKKPNFGPDFGSFAQLWVLKKFFLDFTSWMLQAVILYNFTDN